MENTVQSKRRLSVDDNKPLDLSAETPEANASSGEMKQDPEGRSKLHAADGLAEHMRNPLAPPINITSNG